MERSSNNHLEGIGDLVVWAPVRTGFVEAFESATFETRLRLTLEALFKMRSTAREYLKIKPFADAAERIQSLLDFRIAIVSTPPGHTLLLTATFDRPWEPYIRLIWDPLGSFLDLIFCNCEGYVGAVDSGFQAYADWVNNHQIESKFFYAATGLTVADFAYLAKAEQLQREASDAEAKLVQLMADDPNVVAKAFRTSVTHSADIKAQFEYNDVALEALVAIYKLADFYPPDRLTGDGRFLLRAAQDLLGGWDPTVLSAATQARFADQIGWWTTRLTPRNPVRYDAPRLERTQVQAGILSSYDLEAAPVTHGCLLLMRISEDHLARKFIRDLPISYGESGLEDDIIHNIAFSYEGLRHLNISDADLAAFPREFKEGMADRAGRIGDMFANHPRRWQLPGRWHPKGSTATIAPPVDLSEVDFIIQLRTRAPAYEGYDIGDAAHPLHQVINELTGKAAASGVSLLAVEGMRKASLDPAGRTDHFGFVDGLSQPDPVENFKAASSAEAAYTDEVPLGELLCGYANERGDPAPAPDTYLDNGSFLVVRKLRQDWKGLKKFAADWAVKTPGATPEDLLNRMIGRDEHGKPLVSPASSDNLFDYSADPGGKKCPLQAHIRRAHPRTRSFGRGMPRIARRGLSYGPANGDPAEAERGIIFMAYNASIAEQFEVIQRWINGGNSTGVASCQGDPLIGTARPGDRRTFRFMLNDKVERVDIPQPFVSLLWGLYLFAPSRAALASLSTQTRSRAPTVEQRGQEIIDEISALPEEEALLRWKICLQDMDSKDPSERADSFAIWATIRNNYGGILDTSYGVLVGSKQLVMQVFGDDENYTVAGHVPRMEASFGRIYVGLDSGPQYDREADDTNRILGQRTEADVFQVARAAADAILETWLTAFESLNTQLGLSEPGGKIDLKRDFITPVLAAVSRHYFGIPDGLPSNPAAADPDADNSHFDPGGWDWRPVTGRKPRCPGDFMAPSRSIFYPHPERAVAEYGQSQGKRQHDAAVALFQQQHKDSAMAPITKAIAAAFTNSAGEVDFNQVALNVIGAMTGFLPPTDGNLRGALYEWIKDERLWRIQQDLLTAKGEPYDRAKAALFKPLVQSMQRRPAPDLLWRLAKKDHRLAGLDIAKDRMVVIGVVSATMSDQEAGVVDPSPIFGGTRVPQGSPTHACPAYGFAMGVMLGLLSALLEKGRIQALPAPFVIRISR
ncbi:hypothetical protein ACFB49_08160 [Sphingomonas sp. DBB INV C78]|uniref:hypothetical protein n=1 Tax=Sphingomonas sp. DBB INV C78 TaxID=3349434 RepID=UPI0036D43644